MKTVKYKLDYGVDVDGKRHILLFRNGMETKIFTYAKDLFQFMIDELSPNTKNFIETIEFINKTFRVKK